MTETNEQRPDDLVWASPRPLLQSGALGETIIRFLETCHPGIARATTAERALTATVQALSVLHKIETDEAAALAVEAIAHTILRETVRGESEILLMRWIAEDLDLPHRERDERPTP